MNNKYMLGSSVHPDVATLPAYGDRMVVDLSNTILSSESISRVRVVSTAIPQIMYNIVNDVGTPPMINNTLSVTVGATTHVITVPPGFYNGNALLSLLKTLIDTAFAPAYVCTTSFDTTTFVTQLSMQTALGIPQAFDMSTTSSNAPSILTLLGYYNNSYAGLDTYSSESSLNVFKDRQLMITCEELLGINTNIDSLSTRSWHEGIVAQVPLTGDTGDIMNWEPQNEAKWANLTSPGNQRIFHFRLTREFYPRFGPSIIDWTMGAEFT
jgi:hypothetical protein